MDSNFKFTKDKLYVKNDLSIHVAVDTETFVKEIKNIRTNETHSYTTNFLKNKKIIFTELFFGSENRYPSGSKRYQCHQFITDLFFLAFYENSNLINKKSFSGNAALYFKGRYYGNEIDYVKHKFIMKVDGQDNSILIDNTDEKTMKTIFNKYKRLQKCL